MMIREALSKIVKRVDLTQSEMERTMDEIMSGAATPAQIGALVTALRMKGETVDEITGAAMVMRSKAFRIALNHGKGEPILDTCGTGGDGTNTFNVSTATAFVAAGAGVKVAKHGNRAVSSQCGSADVLEAIGVNIDLDPPDVQTCLEEIGIGFLFAPFFHKAMKYAAGPRKDIGLRTIFNLLGPLTNPAGATVQVLGVYDQSLTEKIANVLNQLGSNEAFVVCGEGTYDEISICSPTKISHLKGGNVNTYNITPEECGLKTADASEIRGGNKEHNAEIIRNILDGQHDAKRDMVLINTAAAFVVAGLDQDLKGGVLRAIDSIDSGKAKEKLEQLISFTKRVEPLGNTL